MENIEIQIKTNIPQVEGEATSLRQKVKDLRKEMESAEVGSDKYNQSLMELSQAMHDLKDQQELLRNSTGELDTVFSNLQQVSTGVVSGFSAVSAAAVLVGGNSEDLQKIMVRLQTGMALVQGLKGFEGMGKKLKALVTSMSAMGKATKVTATATTTLATAEGAASVATKGLSVAMKGLKAALISTGIGALVVALGALVNLVDKMVGKWKEKKEAQDKVAETTEELNTKFEQQNHQLENELKLLQADGASTSEMIQKKRDLIKAQIDETKAAIENRNARIKQIEADRTWLGQIFGSGNGRIKKLKEENDEAAKLLKSLEELQTDTEVDYTVAVKNEDKKRTEDRQKAAKTAADEAKKLRDQQIKNAQEVGKALKKELEEIVKKYSETIESINSVNSILSVNNSRNTAEGVATLIYGIDVNDMKTGLSGVLDSLVNYAVKESKDARDSALKQVGDDADIAVAGVREKYAKALADAKDDKARAAVQKRIDSEIKPILEGKTLKEGEIAEAFEKTLASIYSAAKIPQKTVAEVTGDVAAAEAQQISKDFTERFNSLNRLYKEGIVDYEEYYATLRMIQDSYNKSVEDYDKKYEQELEKSEQRKAELRYNYALKPLDFQKEVGEKFLNELEGQLDSIDNAYENSMTVMESYMREYEGIGQWSQTLTERYEQQRLFIERQKELETERYASEKQAIIDQLNNNMLTVEQKTQLYAQLEQLDRDHLTARAEFNARSAEMDHEYVQSIFNTASQTADALNSLGSAMVSLSKANVEEYERQLETGKINQEEFDKLRAKEADKQAAMQSGMAVMQTAMGIATVWAQSAQLGPIAGPIMAGVQTAAYLVNLAAQLKSIETARKNAKAGTQSTSSSAPDVSQSLISPDAYQSTLSDDTTANLQSTSKTNNRVYVVESDITSAQDKSKTTVTTATF